MTTATTSVMGSGGITLAAEIIGNPEAMPVLLAHGGGQTRRAWKRVTNDLANAGFCAIAFDMRGHGDSAWSEAGAYEMLDFATDLVAIATKMGRRPAVVGASLGGFTSMLLAGELAPGAVGAVVLVDIVPNMDPMGAMRVHTFMNDKMHSGFGSLDEVADAVHQYNPHRPRPSDLAGLRTNLRERDGRWYWHWDPKFIDGTAALPPLEIVQVDRMHAAVDALAARQVPMLLVRGQMSDLVTEDRAEEFLVRYPQIGFVDVSGAGHMVAGDRNDH